MLNRKAESLKIETDHYDKHKSKMIFERRNLLDDFNHMQRKDSIEPHSATVIKYAPQSKTLYSSGELDAQSTVVQVSTRKRLFYQTRRRSRLSRSSTPASSRF